MLGVDYRGIPQRGRGDVTKPIYHIYPLSRLVFADATEWLRILKELDQGRRSMFWSYKPLRNGAFEMASQKAPDATSIYSDVSELAMKAGGHRCQKANLDALTKFEGTFLPQIQGARDSFMDGDQKPIEFGNI
jgi:hypothetical protein